METSRASSSSSDTPGMSSTSIGDDLNCTIVGGQHAHAGFMLIDKPAGLTSAAVVGKLKRLMRQAGVLDKSTKIGHGGTLDPMATGLLVILLGKSTRLADYALHADKAYSGEILLGRLTDTDDVTGVTLSEQAVPEISAERLQQLANEFTGKLSQRPPSFSALKVAGQRAYDLAREGNLVELKEREILVHQCSLKQINYDHLQFIIHSSGGTYIRSLARDIGNALGCGGTLASLRRERSGEFTVNESQTLADGESSKIHIRPWWELLPLAKRWNVEAFVSDRLVGGDQRALNESTIESPPSCNPGELILYCVNGLPHGVLKHKVVRPGERGLELVLHVGSNSASINS